MPLPFRNSVGLTGIITLRLELDLSDKRIGGIDRFQTLTADLSFHKALSHNVNHGPDLKVPCLDARIAGRSYVLDEPPERQDTVSPLT